MTDHRTLADLSERQGWFYSFRLPDGSVTRDRPLGEAISSKLSVLQSMDLRGKRVLDMGCSEGLYSFYAAEQGAQVLGVDIDEQRIAKADFVRDALGFSDVRFEYGDVLDADYRRTLGRFDLVLAWGFLHRVPDPFNALIALGTVSDALSLEWLAFVPPFGTRLSIAHHPRAGAFEWKNIHGVTRADVRENRKGKQADRAPFWLMAPGAIEAVLARLEFTSFATRDRRPGQRWYQAKQYVTGSVKRALGREHTMPDVPVLAKRMMMLAERVPGSVPVDPRGRHGGLRIADWHHAPDGMTR